MKPSSVGVPTSLLHDRHCTPLSGQFLEHLKGQLKKEKGMWSRRRGNELEKDSLMTALFLLTFDSALLDRS